MTRSFTQDTLNLLRKRLTDYHVHKKPILDRMSAVRIQLVTTRPVSLMFTLLPHVSKVDISSVLQRNNFIPIFNPQRVLRVYL